MTPSSDQRLRFEENGFLGPVPVFSASECRRFVAAHHGSENRKFLDWDKGRAVASRAYFDAARNPRILEVVNDLLGDDFMLWGASVVNSTPGYVHEWHSDIESSMCGGRTVSVWIGLENATRDSALLLINRTHLFGTTIQEVAHQHREENRRALTDVVLRWARERDENCELIHPEITDGDALFFDGRLWHGSHNVQRRTRRALLLQYATPDAALHIPDLNNLDWPFRMFEVPRPPCIMIQGNGNPSVNRLVSGPLPAVGTPGEDLRSRVHPIRLPLAAKGNQPWTRHPMAHGATADLQLLTIHASVLSPGHTPHPPHRHDEEELLFLLRGELDLLLPDAKGTDGGAKARLQPGEFVYYPAHFSHTLCAAGTTPACYLMFKWHNQVASGVTENALEHGRWSWEHGTEGNAPASGFHPQKLFDGPTRWLRKLHCHLTELAPGAGYEPHVDAYDVAIVVVSGEIETLGARAKAFDVVFCRAGEPHGMVNPGAEPARYLVFEFHGRALPVSVSDLNSAKAWLIRLLDLRRWKRKLKSLAKRILGKR